jgi:hypothetical protein
MKQTFSQITEYLEKEECGRPYSVEKIQLEKIKL